MQPNISSQDGGASVDASMVPCSKRSAFKVTFACRIPEALRSNAAGCGAVVGFMRYNKMRHDADAASWVAASVTADDSVVCIRHEDHACLSPHTAGTVSGSSSVRASTPDVAAMTPISNDEAGEHASDDAGYGFEANRRHALELSRDSSWVLASPCRSCGWATPASVRRSVSCTTNDAATEHSASDDDDVGDFYNGMNTAHDAAVAPSEWDLLLPNSPQHPVFGSNVRRYHPAAIPIRFLKPL
jgi:hypothetical protein